MAHPRNSSSTARRRNNPVAGADKVLEIREGNRLKDEVYREMLLLELNRLGSEMGLALALLRVIIRSDSFTHHTEFREWLRAVCPIGLHMIEASLDDDQPCHSTME